MEVRSRGSDFDIPVVFSLIIALLRNKFGPEHICSSMKVTAVSLMQPLDDSCEVETGGDARIQACFRDELNNVVKEEDGEWICFSGGNNLLGTKKYQGSNSSDGGNTRDGVKIAGGVIGSGGRIESSVELKKWPS
ncbi:hypothetical protein Tco_0099202 [Tanacetum coccineum]